MPLSSRSSFSVLAIAAAAAAAATLSISSALAASFATINLKIAVGRPAADVWAKVGPYCAIQDWLKTPCQMSAGSGDVGSIRKLGATGATVELLVGKTPLSYTYVQTAGGMADKWYHGTLAVEPSVDGKTSTILYSLVYDEESYPTQDAKDARRKGFVDAFQRAIETMKGMAEGG
ncbi:MAG: SRPBCC family protein [Bauldia sp.]